MAAKSAKPRSAAKSKSTGSSGTAKKSGSKKPSSAKKGTAKKRENASPDTTLVRVWTVVLFVTGIAFLICLLLPEKTGELGAHLSKFEKGLCGGGALLGAVLFIAAAFQLKRDAKLHVVPLKAAAGILSVALLSSFFHIGHWEDAEFAGKQGKELIRMFYEEGAVIHGGGVLGGLLTELLRYTGTVGALLISIPLFLVMLLAFFGMTPKSFFVKMQYLYYKILEKRDTVRSDAQPIREADRAAAEERREELSEMRRAHAKQKQNLIEERRRRMEARRAAEEERAKKPAASIDADIFAGTAVTGSVPTETAESIPDEYIPAESIPAENIPADETVTKKTAPAGTAAGESAFTGYTEQPENAGEGSSRKHRAERVPGNGRTGQGISGMARHGAPVPGSVYDRGSMNASGSPIPAPLAGSDEPAAPDADAYSRAERDVREELAAGGGNEEILTAEAAEKPVVPTSELDLEEIFADPKEENETLVTRYGPSSPLAVGEDPRAAETELSVTRSVPDGCEGTPEPEDAETFSETEDDMSDTADALPDTDAALEDAETASDTAASPEARDASGEPSPDAMAASLNAVYRAETPAPQTPEAPVYFYPPVTLLKKDTSTINEDLSEELRENGGKLESILRSFNVKTKIVNISRGPTITRYELQPEAGTRVRSVANLVDDIALGLAASGVRIEAPIPGKSAIGVEVPNRTVSTVYIRSLIDTEAFRGAKSRLTTCLGMDVAGTPMYLDIAKMPHLLICGATGTGKSVCINSLIVSMLYKAQPDEVKMILIDPKKVELNIYSGIPHLLVPVVSDPKKAAGALHWAVTEMERRFELIEDVGMRDIKGYNEITKNDPEKEHMTQIVIIIDELADLMMTAPDDVEQSICRIAQKARAAGMHLIIGTQRPSVDVITGLIKANVPSRIAFRVSSQIDSRVVLDIGGAEKLIGRGDMLYAPVGAPKPTRIQGAYVSEEEIDDITTFLKKHAGHAAYSDDIVQSIEKEAALCGQKKGRGETEISDAEPDGDGDDPMLRSAIELAVESGKISTSLIQRRLSLGYGRAAKLIDRMEQLGYVSAPEGQKPRQVLITKEEYMELALRQGDNQ